ncbi:hypothetical protein G6F56_014240 [Rhizopus delemar]|nr:hypothetical protein G6F56_014240 [Rhizopus delemar]
MKLSTLLWTRLWAPVLTALPTGRPFGMFTCKNWLMYVNTCIVGGVVPLVLTKPTGGIVISALRIAFVLLLSLPNDCPGASSVIPWLAASSDSRCRR